MNLTILHSDEEFVVVDKPSGLMVHPSLLDRYEKHFVTRILQHQLNRKVYTVHRLDRGTSGAMIVALNPNSARALAKQFEAGLVGKVYLALVRGWISESIQLDYPLKDERDAVADFAAKPIKPPQSAISHIQPHSIFELPLRVDRYPTSRYSLVVVQPQTGRKHQIRRHLSHLRHPIIGDVNYGIGKQNRLFKEHFGIQRLLLACRDLTFLHPISGKRILVQAPLASDFKTLLDQLNLRFRQ